MPLPMRGNSIKNLLDWQVPVKLVSLNQYYDSDSQLYENKRVLISDTPERRLFNVVSDRYTLIEHEKAIEEVQRAIMDVFEFPLRKAPMVLSLDRGGSIIATYDLMNAAPMLEPVKGDRVGFNLDLYNSYDGRFPLKAELFSVRLVCTNGATIKTAWSSISSKHFGKMAGNDAFSVRLRYMFNKTKELETMWAEWNDIQVGFDDPLIRHIYEQFPVKKYIRPLGLEGLCPMSKWDLYNTMTQMITHRVRKDKQRITMDHNLARIFYD